MNTPTENVGNWWRVFDLSDYPGVELKVTGFMNPN